MSDDGHAEVMVFNGLMTVVLIVAMMLMVLGLRDGIHSINKQLHTSSDTCIVVHPK